MKESHEAVVIFLWEGIDFMIMASGAADGGAKKSLPSGGNNIIELIKICKLAISGFIIPDAQSIVCGCDQTISAYFFNFIACELFFDELVVGFV